MCCVLDFQCLVLWYGVRTEDWGSEAWGDKKELKIQEDKVKTRDKEWWDLGGVIPGITTCLSVKL
jgi:hypothetical protein